MFLGLELELAIVPTSPTTLAIAVGSAKAADTINKNTYMTCVTVRPA